MRVKIGLRVISLASPQTKQTLNASCQGEEPNLRKALHTIQYETYYIQKSGRKIGSTREWNGVYYLNNEDSSFSTIFFLYQLETSKKVLLYHYSLGHPSLRVIKKLFPILFKTLDVESLRYDVCELAKHKHVPFTYSNKMSIFLFYLVNIDVWCPVNISQTPCAR